MTQRPTARTEGTWIAPSRSPPRDLAQMSAFERWRGMTTGHWPVAAPPQSEVARMGLGHGKGQHYPLSPEAAHALAVTARVVAGVLPAPPDKPVNTPPMNDPETASSATPHPRSAAGQFRPTAPPIEKADEQMSDPQVRSWLHAQFAQWEHGKKGPFAKYIGVTRQTSSGIARGKKKLFPAVRRRISRAARQLERGELVWVATGRISGGVPQWVLRVQERPRAAPPSINARKD